VLHGATACETAWRALANSTEGDHPLDRTRLNDICLCAISQLNYELRWRCWTAFRRSRASPVRTASVRACPVWGGAASASVAPMSSAISGVLVGDEELPANLGRHASRECTIVFRRHRPRRRTIQYSRDASDGIDRPRRTGYPPSRVWRSVLPRQCRFARN